MGAGEQDSENVSLREHILALLAEMDRRFDAAIAAQNTAVQIAMIASEKAATLAQIAAEKRFELMNEFRGQLADQASTFIPRAEADARLGAMGEKIDDLKGSSKAGASALWGWIASGGLLIVAVVTLLIRH